MADKPKKPTTTPKSLDQARAEKAARQRGSVTPENARAQDDTPPKRRSGQRMTTQEREGAQTLFLETFAKTANTSMSCRAAAIERPTFYRWLEHDTKFSIRYKWAEAEANDLIRGAILKRAVTGVQRVLHSHGEVVTEEVWDAKAGRMVKRNVTVTEYSDTLLMFLAKSRMPEFKDKQQVEVSGRDGGAIETHSTHTVSLDLHGMPTEKLLALRALLRDTPAEE